MWSPPFPVGCDRDAPSSSSPERASSEFARASLDFARESLDFEQTREPAQDPTPEPGPRRAAPSTPSMWQAHADPASGKTYYFNLMSGLTTWERPAEL